MSEDDLVEVNFSSDTLFEEPSKTIEISVTGASIVSKGMKKHVKYMILCKNDSDIFQSTRRYKEFFILRSFLTKYWPGCNIPQIPPKKAIGNMTSIFIERRRRLLEQFLLKISKQSYLFSCDIFQLFLKVEGDFKSIINWPISPSFQFISNTFQKQLHLEHYNLKGDEESVIKSYTVLFMNTLENIKLLKKHLKTTLKTYSKYSTNHSRLMKQFNKVSESYQKCEAPCRNSYINPHQCIYDWAINESLDMKSILESINERDNMNSELAKLEKKLKEHKQELEKLKIGKKSFYQKLSGKSFEDLAKLTENKINDTEDDIYNLNLIKNIVTVKIVYRDIEEIVKKGLFKFEGMLGLFAQASIQEYTVYQTDARSIRLNQCSN